MTTITPNIHTKSISGTIFEYEWKDQGHISLRGIRGLGVHVLLHIIHRL